MWLEELPLWLVRGWRNEIHASFFYITHVEITYSIQASVMDKILTFIIFTDATFPSICGKA